jgi:hypothetical protein
MYRSPAIVARTNGPDQVVVVRSVVLTLVRQRFTGK